MKISIITPAYNCEETIKSLYENIKKIISKDVDWVIVNDCSTDRTKHILHSFQKENEHIIIVNLDENSGPSKARKIGVEHCSGELVFFLDADDYIYEKNFEDFINFAKEKINFSFYYAPIKSVSHTRLFNSVESFCVEKISTIKQPTDFIKYGFPHPSSLLVKREFYLMSESESDLQWGEDFLTFMCLSLNGIGVRWEKPVSCYVISGYGRGSVISLHHRIMLSIRLFKTVVKEKKKIVSGLVYTTYLTGRHIASFLYKKTKSLKVLK